MPDAFRKWTASHPDVWEFIRFTLLSGCATLTNFVVMWICTGFVFKGLSDRPFRFLCFNYTDTARSLGLCGFLSFLAATAAAQTVNFFVQKNFVFRSDAAFGAAVPKFILLAVVLVIVSAALPAYSQALFLSWGAPAAAAPTLANMLNITVQVAISYPAMKFLIMTDKPEDEKEKQKKTKGKTA